MEIVATVRTNAPTIRLDRDGSDLWGNATSGSNPNKMMKTNNTHPLVRN
jgi:hypothetical protein